MTRMVVENVETIQTYIESLSDQYQNLANIEEDLTRMRTNLRTAQITQAELEIQQAEAQTKLDEDRESLQLLAQTIEARRIQWETRIEDLNIRITSENDRLLVLQASAQTIFDELINDISGSFEEQYPACYETVQPFLMSIYQLIQYQDQLQENT